MLHMKQASILIVDDDPINYAVIDAVLEGEGYALHYAASGFEAIAKEHYSGGSQSRLVSGAGQTSP